MSIHITNAGSNATPKRLEAPYEVLEKQTQAELKAATLELTKVAQKLDALLSLTPTSKTYDSTSS